MKGPLAALEKWKLLFCYRCVCISAIVSLHAKDNEVSFGRRDEEASSLSSLWSRQDYVRA